MNGQVSCTLKEVSGKKFEVTVSSENAREYFPREKSIVTEYSKEFIEKLFHLKGKYVCDELHRESVSIPYRLGFIVEAYNFVKDSRKLDVLDFGSGVSSSTLAISSLLRPANITCLELEENFVKLAKSRVDHHSLRNIEFVQSNGGLDLPEVLKERQFDVIILSAVVEHMLPEERKNLLPKLWSLLKPGGHVVVYETPHRWFPIEVHTTSLPLLNYIPLALAWRIGSYFTRKNKHRREKIAMLRAGLRGTSKREMRRYLGSEAVFLEPEGDNKKDIIDIWFSSDYHRSRKKEITYIVCKALKKIVGVEITPWVTYVIKKPFYHTRLK